MPDPDIASPYWDRDLTEEEIRAWCSCACNACAKGNHCRGSGCF